MKRRISNNIRWVRFILLAIAFVMFIFIISLFSDFNQQKEQIIIQLFSLLLIGVSYYFFDQTKTIEFDSSHMFVIGKSREEKVNLKDVYKITLSGLAINKTIRMWKISYYSLGQKKSVRIFPRFFNNDFEEFKDLVYKSNNDVRIISHTLHFDH